MNNITNNLIKIRNYIQKISSSINRKSEEIKLLAVSKSHSINNIKKAILSGQTSFGENYIQESIKKIKILNHKLDWHFIGKIQTNKIRFISQYFSWCHSIENTKSAIILNNMRSNSKMPLNVLIQININNETTKQGIVQDKIFSLASKISKLPHLKFRGIMGFPKFSTNYEEQLINNYKISNIFYDLKKEYTEIDTLSLGTSHDFKSAIICGSTMLRIGFKIFGQSDY